MIKLIIKKIKEYRKKYYIEAFSSLTSEYLDEYNKLDIQEKDFDLAESISPQLLNKKEEIKKVYKKLRAIDNQCPMLQHLEN